MREAADRRTDARFLAITVAVIVVILYLSFFPFHFSSRGGSPLGTLLSTYREKTARSDALGNLLLYFPLGFFAAQIYRQRSASRYILPVTALGAGLSFAVELVQFYDASRVSSMADVYANTIGTLAGAAAAALVGRHWQTLVRAPKRHQYFVLLMIVSWLAYRLFPYMPTIDPHQYWGALKPLIFSPQISWQALYRHFATGLAVAALVAELVGVEYSRLAAPAALLAVVCLRVTIAGLTLSPAEVLGTLAAALVWALVVSRLRWRIPLITALFALMIAIQSLEPFTFLAERRPFGWVPFLSLLHGSRAVNLISFFEKVFTYGTIVWLVEECGWRLWIAAVAAAGFVMALRLCQVYLPGRSAEITDTIMVLLLAGLMALLAPARRTR